MIRANDLRHQVLFQKRADTQDSFGSQSPDWVTVAKVWAKLEVLSGRELVTARAVFNEVSHTVTIRYQSEFEFPSVVAKMRMVYRGRYFSLSASMNVDERDRVIQIMAAEGLNYG